MSVTSALREALDLKTAVDFRTFVTSKEFCGNSSIYKFWLDKGVSLKEGLNELILDGSIGGGKTTFANYYFAWRVYRLLLEGPVQKQLGLSEDSEIYCFYFSVSLSVAKKAGFRQLYTIFQNCKWFKDNAPVNEDLKSSIEFKGSHLHIDYASTEYHAIGLNVWGFILDEANFRQGVGVGVAAEYAEVTQMYTQLLDRVISRNANPDGTFNGLAILISSASYQSSFVEQRKQVIKTNSASACITSRGYEVRPDRYSKEKFTVFIGNGSFEARVIEDKEQMNRLYKELDVSNPDEFFLQVPVSLKSQFEQNIVLALQNHCGVPTMIEGAFMSNTSSLVSSYRDLPLYFTSETLTASTEDDTQLIEYFVPANVVYPERAHSLFLDLSVQHDTGSLVCYRYDGKVNGLDMHTRVFSLRIVPPQYPAQTKISKVRQLIVDLSRYLTITAFSSDQYQCLHGDTLIPTIRGVIPIKDIRVGDCVFSDNLSPIQVKNVFTYEAPLVEMTSKRGFKIKCTLNHRNRYFKYLRDKSKVTWLAVPNDSLGCRIDSRGGFPIQGDYQDFSGVLLDEKTALFLGVMTGDGGLSKGTPYIVSSRSEYDLYHKVISDLGVPFIKCKKRDDRGSFSFSLRRKSALRDALRSKFGYTYNAICKSVPKEIFMSPLSVVASFLKGLYTSDGSCSKEQVVLTSISKRLLEQVQVLLNCYFNVKSTIVKSHRGYRGDYPTKIDYVYYLRTFGDTTGFQKIGFLQDYKNKRLSECIKHCGKGYADYITDVQFAGFGKVYDIEVDSSDHLYCLFDRVTHNSSQLRQDICEELGLENIRTSLDSTDVPYLHWYRALVDGRIVQSSDKFLEKECKEAIHDYKRHRVLKNKNSSDDVLQGNVGAFFISDTYGKQQGATVDGLHQPINLVGGRSVEQVLHILGYK